MFIKQKDVFFSGGGVGGLTEDALLVFLVEVLRKQNKKKFYKITNIHLKCLTNGLSHVVWLTDQ